MKRSKPITFFGSDRFGARILQALIDADWPISLVVTSPRRRKGRRGRDESHPVLDLVRSKDIEAITPSSRLENDDLEKLEANRTDTAVLASFGVLLPESVLRLYDHGIVNVHPSLLPRWRGASPIESAILHGDKETGVSLMRLITAMDAGPAFAQRKVKLTGRETQGSLYELLSEIGARLLVERLPGIVNDTTKPKPQPDIGITYAPRLKKSDGVVDWSLPAEHIERQIRAYQMWPQARTMIHNHDLAILSAEVAMDEPVLAAASDIGKPFVVNDKLYVLTGEGVLRLKQLKPAGKRIMDEAAFINGYIKNRST